MSSLLAGVFVACKAFQPTNEINYDTPIKAIVFDLLIASDKI